MSICFRLFWSVHALRSALTQSSLFIPEDASWCCSLLWLKTWREGQADDVQLSSGRYSSMNCKPSVAIWLGFTGMVSGCETSSCAGLSFAQSAEWWSGQLVCETAMCSDAHPYVNPQNFGCSSYMFINFHRFVIDFHRFQFFRGFS